MASSTKNPKNNDKRSRKEKHEDKKEKKDKKEKDKKEDKKEKDKKEKDKKEKDKKEKDKKEKNDKKKKKNVGVEKVAGYAASKRERCKPAKPQMVRTQAGKIPVALANLHYLFFFILVIIGSGPLLCLTIQEVCITKCLIQRRLPRMGHYLDDLLLIGLFSVFTLINYYVSCMVWSSLRYVVTQVYFPIANSTSKLRVPSVSSIFHKWVPKGRGPRGVYRENLNCKVEDPCACR